MLQTVALGAQPLPSHADDRLTMSLPGGGTFQYQYGGYTGCILPKDDPNSLAPMLVHVLDDQGRRVDYWNDLLGRPFEVYSNQVAAVQGNPPTPASYVYTAYNYDAASDTGYTHNWLTEISNTLYVGGTGGGYGGYGGYGGGPATTTLSENDYTYDNACQRLSNQITDNNGAQRTELYGYDDLNRLVSVDYGDGQTQGYSFDPMGVRHEVAQMIVARPSSRCNPAFHRRYATSYCGEAMNRGKHSNNVSCLRKKDARTVRGGYRCKHQSSKGQACAAWLT